MFAIQAVLNSVLPFTLIAWAEHHIDAGLAVILIFADACFHISANRDHYRHEMVNGRKLFGVMIGLVGTVVMIGVQALNGFGDVVLAQVAVILARLFMRARRSSGRTSRVLIL